MDGNCKADSTDLFITYNRNFYFKLHFCCFFPSSVMNIEVLPLGEARVVITPICTCDCNDNVSHVTIM